MNLSKTYFYISFLSLCILCNTLHAQLLSLDSIIKQWELKGIPPEHINEYNEFKISKKNFSDLPVLSIEKNLIKKTTIENICYNPGFELSDFSNWDRIQGQVNFQGTIIPLTNYTYTNTIGSSSIINNGTVFSNDFVINTAVVSDSITGNGYDYYSYDGSKYNLKTITNTGGNFSSRINNAVPNFKARKIKYTFKVTANEPFLIYNYAYVFSDGEHEDGEQAAFAIELTDSTGNSIPTAHLPYMENVNNAINNPSYNKSFIQAVYIPDGENTPQYYDVYYKKWATDTVNLCQYVGRTISISFEALHCIYGAHFCYGYVDAKCSSAVLPTKSISCRDSLNFGFLAPPGYQNYQWIDAHGNILSSSQTGTQSFLNFIQYLQNCTTGNCSTNDNDVFTLQVTTNLGCVLTTTYSVKNYSINTSVSSIINSCEGGNSGSISLNPSGGLSGSPYVYSWYNNSCTGNIISSSNPLSGISAGNYCVHITSGNCLPKDTIIQVNTIPTTIKSNIQNLPNCLDSTYTIYSLGNGINYYWYQNNILLSSQTSDSLNIDPTNLYNTYTLVYSDIQGCKDSTLFRLLNATATNDSFKIVSCPNDSLALNISPSTSNNQWYVHGEPILAQNGGTNDSLLVYHHLDSCYVIYTINNCKKIANNAIRVFPEQFFTPNQTTNVFTPNNDGINDKFYPYEHSATYSYKEIDLETNNYELHVYNRWGILMYKGIQYSEGWNGKTLNGAVAIDGTYFWIASYISNCSLKNEKIIKKGFVQLFR